MLLILISLCLADELFIMGTLIFEGAINNYTNKFSDKCGNAIENARKISVREYYILGRTIAQNYAMKYNISDSLCYDNFTAIQSLYSFMMGLYTPGTGYVLSDRDAFPCVEDLSILESEIAENRDRVLPYYSKPFSLATYYNSSNFPSSIYQVSSFSL